MFIIDFRNKLVSDYRFSVIGNSNVDKVDLVSHFTQYASGYSIYLKVRSDDERYVDKIAIASENVSVDEDVLVCRWTMGLVSTQCKKLYLQLQFEQGENIIAQSRIVSVVLGDTINVDELIPVIYPQILKELQDQIDTLKADSFAGASMSYSNDTLSLVFKNKDNETLTSLQVSIPTSDKYTKTESDLRYALVEGDNKFTDRNRFEKGIQLFDEVYNQYDELYVEDDMLIFGKKGVKQVAINFVSKDITFYDIENNITKTYNFVGNSGNIATEKYVDDKIEEYKELSYQDVDITEYPTLNDFLASEGEKGYLYLYPIDTSDLTKGYYRYVWENNAWLDLGTTQIDLSGYQPLIDSSHKLSADLVDDTNTTNKFTNATEKQTWNDKQNALVSGTNIKTINNHDILGSGNQNIDEVEISTTEPTSANTSGLTKIIHLANEPTTKYSGYLYLIDEEE